jgi:hypothetical protein
VAKGAKGGRYVRVEEGEMEGRKEGRREGEEGDCFFFLVKAVYMNL